MDIILGILTAIGGLLLITVIRLVTTFFHEMGHAIPALLFTKKKVSVFVGSYGDIAKTLKLEFGRLKMYLKFNLFEWNIGLCRQEEAIKSTWKKLIVVLGGPIASLLVAIPIIMNIKALQAQSGWFFLALVFIAAATIDLIVNLTPRASSITLDGGGMAYSDGYQILAILRNKLVTQEEKEFQELYEKKAYADIISKTENLKENESKRYLFAYRIEALTQTKEYQKAIDIYQVLYDSGKLDKSDYLSIGQLYRKVEEPDVALRFFDQAYKYYYTNPVLLTEMSTCHMTLGDNRKAIKLLTNCINTTPKHIDAYRLRAKAYDKIWEHELAEKDKITIKRFMENV